MSYITDASCRLTSPDELLGKMSKVFRNQIRNIHHSQLSEVLLPNSFLDSDLNNLFSEVQYAVVTGGDGGRSNPTNTENQNGKIPPAVSLLEYIEVHLVAVEIVVGVENLGDGVVDAGQDLLLVRGHALHATLGHEH